MTSHSRSLTTGQCNRLHGTIFGVEKIWHSWGFRQSPEPKLIHHWLHLVHNHSRKSPYSSGRAALQSMWFSLAKQMFRPNSSHQFLLALLLVLLNLVIHSSASSCHVQIGGQYDLQGLGIARIITAELIVGLELYVLNCGM